MPQAVIVEDNAAIRRRAVERLRARHYEVTAVDFGADVVEEVKAIRPGLCILDVRSSQAQYDLALVKELVKQSPDMTILVLAEAKPWMAHFSREWGTSGVDYLKKPFEWFEFEHRLSCLKTWSEMKRALAREKPSVTPSLAPVTRELHDPETGRLDAKRIADYLNVKLSQLTNAIGRRYQTVHKSPTAESLQPLLAPLARIIELLERMLGNRRAVLVWLNRQHPDLGKRQPLAVILKGHGSAVETLLENALQGLPS